MKQGNGHSDVLLVVLYEAILRAFTEISLKTSHDIHYR